METRKSPIYFLISLLMFLFVMAEVQAGQAVIKIMNYNVKGVPVFWYWHFRHKYIGKELKKLKESGSVDIVALQEVMSRRAKRINKYAKFPHKDRGPEGKGFKTSSGLEVLSKFPILANDEIKFSKCSGFDCMSRKGVQFTRIWVPGAPTPIDIYNTHMNASAKAYKVRLKQVEEMTKFIERTHEPSFPMIALGDFNFRRDSQEYENFSTYFSYSNAAKTCSELQSCEGYSASENYWNDGLIDHQFYTRDFATVGVKITPIYYEHLYTDHEVGRVIKQNLSDHPGVLVHYLIEW